MEQKLTVKDALAMVVEKLGKLKIPIDKRKTLCYNRNIFQKR